MSVHAPSEATGRPALAGPALVGMLAALLVGTFVLVSTLVSILPAFRFESQFPAVLPFFAWAGAAGVGHWANLARSIQAPWRQAFGPASVVPYAALMLLAASLPGVGVPWWLAPAAAAAAAAPFVVVGLRARPTLAVTPGHAADDRSLRGTFLIGLSLMLMAYAVAGPSVAGAVVSVLLAVGLTVAGMMAHGLARASRTWSLAHWVCLAWGSLVVWGSVLLHGLTSFFQDTWFVLTAVLLAGGPLIAVNSAEARRGRPAAD